MTNIDKAIATITRQQVTWVRWENGRERISHPYVYHWADDTGYVRSADTKGQAHLDILAYYSE